MEKTKSTDAGPIRVLHSEDIERIVRQIVDIADPLRVILFGSAARGEAKRDSDVDLLVVVPDGTPCREVMGDLFQRVTRVGVACDFLVVTPSKLEEHRDTPGLVYRTILKEGNEVYSAMPQRDLPEPGREPKPDAAAEWLRYARSDLTLAQVDRAPGVIIESLCYHAQQAAEKALKALLVLEGAEVPRTHSIAALVEQVAEHFGVPGSVLEAEGLTQYAVVSRYPSDVSAVSDEEYRRAVALAEAVVSWAEREIEEA